MLKIRIIFTVVTLAVIFCSCKVANSKLDVYVLNHLRDYPLFQDDETITVEKALSRNEKTERYKKVVLVHKKELKKKDVEKVSRLLNNACMFFLNVPNRSYDLGISRFKELRFLESGQFNQHDLNGVLVCPNLICLNLKREYSDQPFTVVDSIPSYISKLSKLRYLYLDHTRRKYKPINRPDPYVLEAYDSTSIFYNLNFKYEHLTRGPVWIPAFPEGFGELPLKELRMSGNKTNSLQNCVGDLKQLEELILTGNNYDAGLENIGRIKTLKRLVLDLGGSTGELPDDVFKDLQNLEELIITWEYLVKLPSSIGLLKNLKSLKIMFCDNLTTIPASVEASFNNIDYVKIKGNKYLKDRIIDNRKK